MKKLLLGLGILVTLGLLALFITSPITTKAATPPFTAFQGGTGSSSPFGILVGDSTIRLKTLLIGSNLSFDGTTLSATGGGGTFPFTPFTSYNGTSTPIGFSAGLFTNGSTTITSVGSGFVQAVNGLLSAAALTGAQVITALGFTPAPFEFTPSANYNSTSTPIGFLQGLFSVGSTTISTLGSGLVGANNGRLYGFASSSLFGYIPVQSVTASAPLFSSGGVNPNLTWFGLSTTSALTQSNLLYNTTAGNGVAGVATTSVTCSGNTTCTTFTAIGPSPITISSTGGGTGLSTTSPIANSNVLTYSSAGAGAAYGTATTTLAFSGPFTGASLLGALVGGSNSTVLWTGLATTSNLTQGQVLYNTTNGNGVASVGTSTPTVSAPITYSGTLGSFIGGIAGTFACTLATGSVTGCLSTTDWNTFNNKISSTSLSATFPLTYTSATGVFTNSFSTTTNTGMSAGSLYIGSGGIMQTAASSSIFGFIPEQVLTFVAPLIRTANSIAWTGLATTTQPSSSNLLVSNGGAGVYGVATSSATCAGTVSCTPFVIIGGTPITLTGSGGSGSGLATTSPTANDQVLVYNSAGAGSAYSIATTSLSISGPFTIANPIGVLKNGGITYTGLATTSNLTQGQLLYNTTGGNGVASVATSAPTVTAPITYSGTLGAFVGGVGGAFDCTSASLSVKGCLTAADYTIFNNKISSSSLSGASVISYNSGTGVITTTPGTFAGATAYTFPQDLIITGNSTSTVGAFTTSASTTALTISNTPSCSGSNALTTNASGLVACGAITGGGGSYPFTPGVFGATNVSATSTALQLTAGLYASSTVRFGNAGVSPFLFDGTTGNLGLGTTTPATLLEVQGDVSGGVSRFTRTNSATNAVVGVMKIRAQSSGQMSDGFGGAFQFYNQDADGVENGVADIRGIRDGADNSGALTFSTNSSGSVYEGFRLTTNSYVGIGSTSPFAKLSIHQGPTDVINKTLFAIGSSTATATTTLFSVSNTGSLFVTGLSGCLNATAGVVGSTGSACGSGGGTYSFFPFSTYATTTTATTSPLFSAGGFFASTTSAIPSLAITQSGTGPAATFMGANVGIGTTSPVSALSVTGTTTLSSKIVHTGTVSCNNPLGPASGLEVCGSDSTSAGVQLGVANNSTGASAYSALFLNNDLADNSITHYGTAFLNSSKYTDTAFGTGVAMANQLGIQNTDGPISIIAGTSTNAGFINFLVGSSASTSEAMRIASGGNVGVGTSSPYGLLSVGAPAGTNPYFVIGSTTGEVAKITAAAVPQFGLGTSTPFGSLTVEQGSETASVWIANQGSTSPSFMVGGVNQNGTVGIGTTTTGSSTPLVVGANIASAVAAFGNTLGMCYVNPGNGLSCTSDARMKKNVENLKSGLSTVLRLRAVFFNWKKETDSQEKHPGFIAQEVQQLAPDLIYTDNNGLLTMDYARLTPYLVEAVQEQQKEIEAIKVTAVNNWQWVAIGLLALWNLYLTFKRKRI